MWSSKDPRRGLKSFAALAEWSDEAEATIAEFVEQEVEGGGRDLYPQPSTHSTSGSTPDR